MGIRNTMLDLNDHLFAELERLSDEELSAEELDKEIRRAKAISDISKNVVANAANVLKAAELNTRYGRNDVPRILIGDDPEKKKEMEQLKLGVN